METIQNLFAGLTGREKIGFIDTSQTSLYIAAVAIAFNPIFWNIVARQEYNTHFLTKIFGSPHYGCYALAVTIFGLGAIRDSLYKTALEAQPIYPPLHQPALGVGLFLSGNVLVLTSMYALGVTGTYLGDYFGILMDNNGRRIPVQRHRCAHVLGKHIVVLGHGSVLWPNGRSVAHLASVFDVSWSTTFRRSLHRQDLCPEGNEVCDPVHDKAEGAQKGVKSRCQS